MDFWTLIIKIGAIGVAVYILYLIPIAIVSNTSHYSCPDPSTEILVKSQCSKTVNGSSIVIEAVSTKLFNNDTFLIYVVPTVIIMGATFCVCLGVFIYYTLYSSNEIKLRRDYVQSQRDNIEC